MSSGSYAIVTYTAGITSGSDSGTKAALAAQLTAATITWGPTYPDGPQYKHLNEAGVDFNFHTKYNGYEGRVFRFAFMTMADWYRIYGYSNGLDVDVYVRCPTHAAASSHEQYADYSGVMKVPVEGFPFVQNLGRGGVVIEINKMLFIQNYP
jgi:hypothetical protein